MSWIQWVTTAGQVIDTLFGGTTLSRSALLSSTPAVTTHSDDRHFRTDHLMADLKGRSVRGGAVTLAAQAVKFVLQTGSTMVLARLLTPQDFGLVAMVTAVTGFVAMFKDAGLSTATVQRERITHNQVSTLFWINVGLSVAVMLVVAALAPGIAWFYGEPQLAGITLALAGTFVFGGLTVQHQALLRRQMRFRALATIEVASLATGIATAIAMGFASCGCWSLVGMTAGTAVANCVLVWLASGWRPGRPVRGSGVRSMLAFGGGLTTFSVLNYFTRHADNVIIGYALGSGPLGIYSKAYNLLTMPICQFNAPVASVMLPALSRLQNDPERYRRAYLQAISTLAFVGMPLVAFLFVVADEVVAIVLGPRWEGAATVFRWLAPAALLGTINVAPGWLCVSLGRAKVQVIWAAFSAPMSVGAFIVGTQWGVVGVAAAFSISWCVLHILFIVAACHRSPVTFSQVIGAILPAAPISIAAAAACWLFVSTVPLDTLGAFWTLVINSILFAVLVVAMALTIPSGRARLLLFWREGLGMLSLSA